MDNKKIAAIGDIHRALGMIEGVSCGLDESCAQCLIDAVQMIDSAMEVIINNAEM